MKTKEEFIARLNEMRAKRADSGMEIAAYFDEIVRIVFDLTAETLADISAEARREG